MLVYQGVSHWGCFILANGNLSIHQFRFTISGWHCEEKRKYHKQYGQYVSRSCDLSPLTLAFFLIRPPDTSNVAPPLWTAKAKAPMELLPRRGPKRTVSVMLKGSCSTGFGDLALWCSWFRRSKVSKFKGLQIAILRYEMTLLQATLCPLYILLYTNLYLII